MPPKLQDQVLVACPHCGHQQPESRSAFSSICKGCGRHFHVQEALNPVRKASERGPEQRRIACFDCGTELDVPASAESTMCKRCGRYQDLHNYQIAAAVSKNFRTRGRFAVEPKGYVFNTETVASEVVLKGRFIGKLTAEQSLTIYSGAEIKGTFKTPRLIIPAGNHFRWPENIQTDSVEIAGELAGNLQVSGTVTVKSTGRWFGDLTAGNLVVEEGAVVVGNLWIRSETG
jgi:cytoskeletal protein CcmA (bactofilin family)/DNA-directed RNA polymerase subunit RPC12/RpoP